MHGQLCRLSVCIIQRSKYSVYCYVRPSSNMLTILPMRRNKISYYFIALWKGFLSNRFIGENTRLTSDIIRQCQMQNVDGLIIKATLLNPDRCVP